MSAEQATTTTQFAVAGLESPLAHQQGGSRTMPRTTPPASEQEIEEMVLKYRLKARKLSRSILRQWHSRLDIEDVDSVVDLSLCEAARRYDPSFGATFMTFLYFHLRGNLIRAVSEAVTGNGVIESEDDDSARAKSGYLRGDNARNTAKLANASDVAEMLYNQETHAPDYILQQQELTQITKEACDKLAPVEREIIIRIFLKEQPLVDVAHSLGFSRCHISRLKKRALEALSIHLAEVGGEKVSADVLLAKENAKQTQTHHQSIEEHSTKKKRDNKD
jgi:RNA polymerase sigma factor (sigma-70 family)